MTVLLRNDAVADSDMRYAWSREAAEAACRVPASGREAADWAVRGWAEVALGCAALGGGDAFQGLDEVIQASQVACSGPFAPRLRALRSLGGELPGCYHGAPSAAAGTAPLPEAVARACVVLAEYCDGLDSALSRLPGGGGSAAEPPAWATTADHLRWGERFRASAGTRRWYSVLSAAVPAELVRRAWMRLPVADAQNIVLIRPVGGVEATVRQRVRQGLHNGAHLDHLAALASQDAATLWSPSAIEFGSGLLVAEAYAMSSEILAAAECTIAGRGAEARELYRGLVSRMGRIPGFGVWRSRYPAGPAALRCAEAERSAQFATLPTLAAQYVTGPLRLIGRNWADPLIPAPLAQRARTRWKAVCERFEPAAALSAAEGTAEAPRSEVRPETGVPRQKSGA
ncbi:MAG TPA: hypothetical protein VGS97_24725 [Actinocrinis sp.]|uniref:hypothetical protein n=1 Tax=Actinocrinis sp. TaxID=1920516 RepID=UPI002DDC94EB|nr:hypothetical protein [Actinocrinis sp.]HEV2347322.1 hypothetical protein [Actinocrinis sp.]